MGLRRTPRVDWALLNEVTHFSIMSRLCWIGDSTKIGSHY